MSMRLFYAIEFAEPDKHRLGLVSGELAAMAARGRWCRPENLHLTLQFLGECPMEWLVDLRDILHRAAAANRPFGLNIQGCGTFGEAQDILWLGVAPEPSLDLLANTLKVLLSGKGLPFERRPFAAHITLARQVRIDQEKLNAWHFQPISCAVQSISLMESMRAEGILVYRPIERAHLGIDMR